MLRAAALHHSRDVGGRRAVRTPREPLHHRLGRTAARCPEEEGLAKLDLFKIIIELRLRTYTCSKPEVEDLRFWFGLATFTTYTFLCNMREDRVWLGELF